MSTRLDRAGQSTGDEKSSNTSQIPLLLEQIRQRCSVPAISVAAMHEGRLKHHSHAGSRKSPERSSENNKPDLNTAYPISSGSKIFVTAAFCLLVDSGQNDINWDDPINKHLPDFEPEDDASIAQATFKEILRHSSGIANPIVTWLGPKGRPLVPKNKFIEVLNKTSTKRRGQSLRDTLIYSNIAYGLIVLVIEQLSGMSFANFVQTKFLDPLNMKNTAVTSTKIGELDKDNRLAHPYAKLSDGTWEPLTNTWTDENHGPLLGMIGMRSSAGDMLKLISALIQAYSTTATEDSKSRLGAENWSQASFELLEDVEENPFKGVQAMFDGTFWWLPCDCNGKGDHVFKHRTPWVEFDMPCCALSWSSYNMTPSPDDRTDVFGASLTMPKKGIHFNGICIFGTMAMKFFPETRSAVVAFSNGLNMADAAEFAALSMTQWLFELEPKKDILKMVDVEVAQRKAMLDATYATLEEMKSEVSPRADLTEYVGKYSTMGLTLVVSFMSDEERLQLSFEGNKDLVLPLEPYGVDIFSYWPKDRDEWLKDGWLDWDYYEVGLLNFQRNSDENHKVDAATWVWEEGAEPAIFKRVVEHAPDRDMAEDSVNDSVSEPNQAENVTAESSASNDTLSVEIVAKGATDSGYASMEPEDIKAETSIGGVEKQQSKGWSCSVM